MRYLFLIALLAGCASGEPAPEYAKYADCVIPVTREAGMGVRVPGCAAWSFGPSKEQQINFRRHGL